MPQRDPVADVLKAHRPSLRGASLDDTRPETPSSNRKIWTRPPSGKNKPPAPPAYHRYNPDVQKSRPSTASRSSAVGNYKALSEVVERHDGVLRAPGSPAGSPKVKKPRTPAVAADAFDDSCQEDSLYQQREGSAGLVLQMDPKRALEHRRRGAEQLLSRATGMSMEVLACVQQVDEDILARPRMLEFATVGDPYDKGGGAGASGGKSPRKSPRGIDLSAEKSRPLAGLGAGTILEETEEEKARYRHWHRRSPREVLEKKTERLEMMLARKLEDHLRGEERRMLAAEVRISRPLVEKQIQLKMLWLKILYTAQPVIILSEVLRQHQASHVLKTLFSVQLKRFARRIRERQLRKLWLEERRRNMQRPTVEQLRQAVPLLKALPLDLQQTIVDEMEFRCYRKSDYIHYTSVRALALQKRLAAKQVLKKQQSSINVSLTPSQQGLHKSQGATPMRLELDPQQPTAVGSSTRKTAQLSPQPGGSTSAQPESPTGGTGREFGRQEMFFLSTGSAVAHITLAGSASASSASGAGGSNNASNGGGSMDTKLLEVYNPGQAIGLESLMGADIKRQIAVARTDIDGWAIPVQRILEAIETTGDDVRHMLAKLASNRRKEAMRLQPLTPAQVIAASPVLAGWNGRGLKGLIELMQPNIFHRDEEVPLRGVYLIVRGRMEKSYERPPPKGLFGMPAVTSSLGSTLQSGRAGSIASVGTASTSNSGTTAGPGGSSNNSDHQIIKAGMCVGDRECLLDSNHGSTNSKKGRPVLRAIVDTDAWFIPKADFVDLAVHQDIESLIPLFEGREPVASSGGSGSGSGAPGLSHTASALHDIASVASGQPSAGEMLLRVTKNAPSGKRSRSAKSHVHSRW